jgi:hypothetical protein
MSLGVAARGLDVEPASTGRVLRTAAIDGTVTLLCVDSRLIVNRSYEAQMSAAA